MRDGQWRNGNRESLLQLAESALERCDFALAEQLLQEAVDCPSPQPETWNLLGRCALYQGQLVTALGHFEELWECSKRFSHRKFRWKSCFALAEVHGLLDQRACAVQFQQLAIVAVQESLQHGELKQLPVEMLNSLARQPTSSEGLRWALCELQRRRPEEASPTVQAEMELTLGMRLAGAVRRLYLTSSWRKFRQTGNVFGALVCLEFLSSAWLDCKAYEESRRSLLFAETLSKTWGIRTKVADYGVLAARLRRGLALLQGSASSN